MFDQQTQCKPLMQQSAFSVRGRQSYEPIEKIGTLSVFGRKLSDFSEEMHLSISISSFESKTSEKWSSHSMPLDEFAISLSKFVPSASKNGRCFIAGKIRAGGSPEEIDDIEAASVLVFQSHRGASFDDARNRLIDLQVCGGLYSNRAHGQKRSFIRFDQLQKRFGVRLYSEVNDVHVREYLRDMEGYTGTLLRSCRSSGTATLPDGLPYCVVEHDPIQEFRVFLPLKEPIPAAAIHQEMDAEALWEEINERTDRWPELSPGPMEYGYLNSRHAWPTIEAGGPQGRAEFVTGELLDWGDFC